MDQGISSVDKILPVSEVIRKAKDALSDRFNSIKFGFISRPSLNRPRIQPSPETTGDYPFGVIIDWRSGAYEKHFRSIGPTERAYLGILKN